MIIMNALMQGDMIKSRVPFTPHSYESLDQWDRASVAPERYQEYVAWYNQVSDVAFYKIIYESDNLQIVGFLAQPKSLEPNKKYPVIIYNRGGSNENGKNAVWTLKNHFYDWVKAGFIAIASQYRGNDGSQGKEELGGSDVHDVINLYKAMQSDIPYADSHNIFMVGYSRGAIMTYQALRAGTSINAGAVIAGVSEITILINPTWHSALGHFLFDIFSSTYRTWSRGVGKRNDQRQKECWTIENACMFNAEKQSWEIEGLIVFQN